MIETIYQLSVGILATLLVGLLLSLTAVISILVSIAIKHFKTHKK